MSLETDTANLLNLLFDAEGLYAWIRTVPSGEEVAEETPLTDPDYRDVALEYVKSLNRRGRLDGRFFNALISACPDRRREIETLMHRASFGRTTFLRSDLLWSDVGSPMGIREPFIVRTNADSDAPESTESQPDRALLALFMKFLRDAGRSPIALDLSTLLTPEIAFVAQNAPPQPIDARHLASLLKTTAGKRGIFVYRGDLSDRVARVLGELGMAGHPVLQLPERTLQSALADGNCGSVLSDLEHRSFDQQNLFRQSTAVTERRLFFGRASLLAGLGARISSSEHILITGLRKVGKTSLLYMLRQLAPQQPWCWFDLQQVSPLNPGWPQQLFQCITQSLDRWGRATFDATASPWPDDPRCVSNGAELLQAVELRRKWMHSRGRSDRFIVTLDEIERVLPRTGEETVEQHYVEAAGALRALVQSPGERWISLVCADLRPSATVLNILPGGRTNPLCQLLQAVPLPPWGPTETSEMLRDLSLLMGIDKVEQGFCDQLYVETGGHPYLSRLLAANAFDGRQWPNRLTGSDLGRTLAGLNSSCELGNFYEQNLWNAMTLAEQKVVTAAVMTDLPVHSTPSRGSGLRSSAWTAARAVLTDQGILGLDGRIGIGGFHAWLKAELVSASNGEDS